MSGFTCSRISLSRPDPTRRRVLLRFICSALARADWMEKLHHSIGMNLETGPTIPSKQNLTYNFVADPRPLVVSQDEPQQPTLLFAARDTNLTPGRWRGVLTASREEGQNPLVGRFFLDLSTETLETINSLGNLSSSASATTFPEITRPSAIDRRLTYCSFPDRTRLPTPPAPADHAGHASAAMCWPTVRTLKSARLEPGCRCRRP